MVGKGIFLFILAYCWS